MTRLRIPNGALHLEGRSVLRPYIMAGGIFKRSFFVFFVFFVVIFGLPIGGLVQNALS